GTPDSEAIVFDAVRGADSELKYQVSSLYVVDVASGSIRDLVTKAGNWGDPAVSPDGKLVAFTGYEPSGRTHTVSDLFVVDIDGSGMRKISGDYDRNPVNLQWAPDGSGVYFGAEDRGSRSEQFGSLNGMVKSVTTGRRMLRLVSLARGLLADGPAAA